MLTRSMYVDEDVENETCTKKPVIDREIRRGRKVLGDINNVLQVSKSVSEPLKKQRRPSFVKPIVVSPPKEELFCDHLVDTSLQEGNTLCVADYVNDIYTYLRHVEENLLVRENHLEGQQITDKMRAILIDWIVEIHNHFNLLQETFQLTIHIIDRYIDKSKSVNKSNAQLVGLTSIFIAAKYEETEALEMSDLLFVCDSAVKESEILETEGEILRCLEYNLGHPIPLHFIRRYTRISNATPMEHCFAKYFSDIALFDHSLCHVKPSLIASAAVFLSFCVARDEVDPGFWTPALVQYSTYKLSQFYHFLPHLAVLVVDNASSKLQSIRRKYSNAKSYCVSLMPGVQPKTGIINHFCE